MTAPAPDEPAGAEPAAAPHATSVAVWGVPSPVVVGSPFAVTVGVRCAAACALTGQPVVVRDAAGAEVGRGRLGAAPAAGTRALYAAQVTLAAPAAPGVHAWTATFAGREPAAAPAAEPAATGEPAPHAPAHADAHAPAHTKARAAFSFRTAGKPAHRVTVTLRDRDSEAPLGGAEVRVGAYRAATDAAGRAGVDVPAGRYELYVRKAGYVPHTAPLAVAGDVALRVAAAPASEAERDDDRLWM